MLWDFKFKIVIVFCNFEYISASGYIDQLLN